MDADRALTQQKISRLLDRAGLPLHGFCPFSAVADRLLPCRAADRLPENSRSVVAALFPYRMKDTGKRNLSRYACVPDYHTAAGRVLQAASAALSAAFPQARFEAFIDNSPILEVYAAAIAGLGRIGDNGLLLHPQFGSWVFIGCIVTDLDVGAKAMEPSGCLHCGACGRNCPSRCVGAADKPSRCLSAITQKKGELTASKAALLAQSPLIWGCDACQESCPLNRGTSVAPHPCFAADASAHEGWLDRETLDSMDRDTLRGHAYGWRGRAVLERNLQLYNRDAQFRVSNTDED